jgi:hypothetical protein
MQYLPASPIGGFWQPLYSQIVELLKKTAILESWESRTLRLPSQLRIVRSDFLHGKKPLFDDLVDEIYLAPDYRPQDHKMVRELGLRQIHWEEMLDRVDADLEKPQSKMKRTPLGDIWHESFADLLISGLGDMKVKKSHARIRKLEIIPLQEHSSEEPGKGRWVSTNGHNDPIYFPKTEDIPIPRDISLLLVHPHACVTSSRKALFITLGVMDCEPSLVLKRLLERHSKDPFRLRKEKYHLSDLTSDFRYLFRFHPEPNLLKTSKLLAFSNKHIVQHTSEGFYFYSVEEYSADALLENTAKDVADRIAHFLHPSYLSVEPDDVYCHHRSWKQWLEEIAGVRYFPPLVSKKDSSALSPILLQVLEDQPHKFIGALQAHWTASYESECIAESEIRLTLQKTLVRCENGESVELSQTYLPLEHLKAISQKFEIQEKMPFLQLPVVLESSNCKDWQFLEEFGVGHEADLTFHLLMLEETEEASPLVWEMYKCIGNIVNHEKEEQLR